MFPINMFPIQLRPFNTQYRCFSVAMLPGNEREDVERGGKIIMPPSALDHLTRLNINYPMLFKLTNPVVERVTHCGVLEFVAGEGKVYLPLWMMHNLMLDEGDAIQVESISLPVATFSRFQPQSTDFLDISNPKAVLESCLRNFACLTTGDVVNLKYNQKDYQLSVLETQPGAAVTIIECDMNVEFAPPLGYQEPSERKENDDMVIDPADLMPEPTGFVKFRGEGYRLDGKSKRPSESESCQERIEYSEGIPDYDWTFGTLSFIRYVRRTTEEQPVEDEGFSPFSGAGNTLSKPK